MNAVNSSLKDEIKKSREGIKKEKFKFITSILLSNLLVAVLCLGLNQDPAPEKAHIQKAIHASHQMMIVPLSSLLVEENHEAKETPVTLVTREHKIISPRAYLHQFIKKDDEGMHFKIEINNQDMTKVSAHLSEGVIAIPYVEIKKRAANKKTGSKYEVSL